jgi:hypothetical protein
MISNPGVPYGARVNPFLIFRFFAYLFSSNKPLNNFMEAARAPDGTLMFDDRNTSDFECQSDVLLLVKN